MTLWGTKQFGCLNCLWGPCRASGEVGTAVALGKLRSGRTLQNLGETRSNACTRDTELEAKARLENCGISSSWLKGTWPKERGVSSTGFQVKDEYLQKLTKLGNGPICWRYSWKKRYLLRRSWVNYAECRMYQQSGVKYVAVAFLVLNRDHIGIMLLQPLEQLCNFVFVFAPKLRGTLNLWCSTFNLPDFQQYLW